MVKREKLDKRLRLLEAAADMFSEHGYKGTSLRAIAERASVSFQLIHHHFGNKQDLWVAMLDYLYGCFSASTEFLEFDRRVRG